MVTQYKGMMQVCYGSTDIETGNAVLNELVHTNGMSGMMPTIWLIICAQTFGGALTATGQLRDLMGLSRDGYLLQYRHSRPISLNHALQFDVQGYLS